MAEERANSHGLLQPVANIRSKQLMLRSLMEELWPQQDTSSLRGDAFKALGIDSVDMEHELARPYDTQSPVRRTVSISSQPQSPMQPSDPYNVSGTQGDAATPPPVQNRGTPVEAPNTPIGAGVSAASVQSSPLVSEQCGGAYSVETPSAGASSVGALFRESPSNQRGRVRLLSPQSRLRSRSRSQGSEEEQMSDNELRNLLGKGSRQRAHSEAPTGKGTRFKFGSRPNLRAFRSKAAPDQERSEVRANNC